MYDDTTFSITFLITPRYAGVPEDGRCRMKSVMFRFRFCWEVEVKVNNGQDSFVVSKAVVYMEL